MQEGRGKAAGAKRMMTGRRKGIDLSQLNMVETSFLKPESSLPLVVKPAVGNVDLAEWSQDNRDFIEGNLLTYGAILFRGFDLESVAQFEQAAQAICPSLFGDYGDLPPESGQGKVYQSTPYPQDQPILFHNEGSHTDRWPMKQFFFCVKPAQEGGETPIADCRKVHALLDRRTVKQFEEKQLMYVRNFIDTLDVSWEAFFKTTERSVVEQYCRNASIGLQWKPNNGLRIHRVNPAVAKHPKTGEFVFFNQVQLHHISCVPPQVRKSLLSLFSEDDLPRNVYYGDGSAIDESVMQEIDRAYSQAAVSFPWQAGDLLMLDNMLTAHARNPYKGQRKIVVAMGEINDGKSIQRD